MTGAWHRDNGATYSFYEDSRFQQSDKPGAQWVWIKKGNQVLPIRQPGSVLDG
jgi:hypothetical protein